MLTSSSLHVFVLMAHFHKTYLGFTIEPNWKKYNFCEIIVILSPSMSVTHDLDGFMEDLIHESILIKPKHKEIVWSIINFMNRLGDTVWFHMWQKDTTRVVTKQSSLATSADCMIAITSRKSGRNGFFTTETWIAKIELQYFTSAS